MILDPARLQKMREHKTFLVAPTLDQLERLFEKLASLSGQTLETLDSNTLRKLFTKGYPESGNKPLLKRGEHLSELPEFSEFFSKRGPDCAISYTWSTKASELLKFLRSFEGKNKTDSQPFTYFLDVINNGLFYYPESIK